MIDGEQGKAMTLDDSDRCLNEAALSEAAAQNHDPVVLRRVWGECRGRGYGAFEAARYDEARFWFERVVLAHDGLAPEKRGEALREVYASCCVTARSRRFSARIPPAPWA